ncbi:hypothetical protein D3C85_1811140 [compost metagenome]
MLNAQLDERVRQMRDFDRLQHRFFHKRRVQRLHMNWHLDVEQLDQIRLHEMLIG